MYKTLFTLLVLLLSLPITAGQKNTHGQKRVSLLNESTSSYSFNYKTGSDIRPHLTMNSYTDAEVNNLNAAFEQQLTAAQTVRDKVVAAGLFLANMSYCIPYSFPMWSYTTPNVNPEYRYFGMFMRKGLFLRPITENGYTYKPWGFNYDSEPVKPHWPSVQNIGDSLANGFTCSQVVGWCLVNAGLTKYGDQQLYSKWAEQLRTFPGSTEVPLKDGYNDIQPGDFIGFDGHIALVIGVEGNYVIYISADGGGDAAWSGHGIRWHAFHKILTNYDTYPYKYTVQMSNVYDNIVPAGEQDYVYVNPLDRWAEFNLENLNTFATGDPKTAVGKHFQFGRNYSYSSGNAVDKSGVVTDLNNPRAYGPTALFNTNSNAWHSNDYLTDAYTWSKLVTSATDAPESYKGNNSGDPTPIGWHMPTLNESKVLIALGLATNKSEDYGEIQSKTEHTVDILGNKMWPASSSEYLLEPAGPWGYISNSDYVVIDANTVVAHRWKGTVYASAFRWLRVVDGGAVYMQISAKAAEDNTINEIKDAVYDWSDAKSIYLPIAGRLTAWSTNTFVHSSTTEGYYWVDGKAPDDKSGQYALRFRATDNGYIYIGRQQGASVRAVRNTPTNIYNSIISVKINDAALHTNYDGSNKSSLPDFHGADLGDVYSLAIGAQINVIPKTDDGANVTMWYQIDNGEPIAVNVPFNENPSGWSSSKHFRAADYSIDISTLAPGSHTLKVWFQGGRNLTVWDKTNATAYTATFSKNTTNKNAEIIEDALRINVEQRTIKAQFDKPTKVALYSVAGHLISFKHVSKEFSQFVEPGVYILQVNNKGYKVIVK